MKTCCICKKKFEGWGNNPWGYIKDHKVVEWKDTDVCCNDCKYSIYYKFNKIFSLCKGRYD